MGASDSVSGIDVPETHCLIEGIARLYSWTDVATLKPPAPGMRFYAVYSGIPPGTANGATLYVKLKRSERTPGVAPHHRQPRKVHSRGAQADTLSPCPVSAGMCSVSQFPTALEMKRNTTGCAHNARCFSESCSAAEKHWHRN